MKQDEAPLANASDIFSVRFVGAKSAEAKNSSHSSKSLRSRFSAKADKRKRFSGISLFETLITITVFSVLGIIITQAVILTLRGTRKSESTARVRENLNYALAIIERQIRNASSVSCTGQTDKVDFTDQDGVDTSFSCITGQTPYIASGSANIRLTSSEVSVTTCSFVCDSGSGTTPASVTISLVAKEATAVGIEGKQISASTKIFLRTY